VAGDNVALRLEVADSSGQVIKSNIATVAIDVLRY